MALCWACHTQRDQATGLLNRPTFLGLLDTAVAEAAGQGARHPDDRTAHRSHAPSPLHAVRRVTGRDSVTIKISDIDDILERLARPDRSVVLAIHPGTRAALEHHGVHVSSTVRVIGPAWSSDEAKATVPQRETRP